MVEPTEVKRNERRWQKHQLLSREGLRPFLLALVLTFSFRIRVDQRPDGEERWSEGEKRWCRRRHHLGDDKY